MVAQHRKMGAEAVMHAFDQRDRRAEMRIAMYGLVEDPEVESAGEKVTLLAEFENAVERCDQRGQYRNGQRIATVPEDVQASDTLLWSPSISRWACGIRVEGETSTSLPIRESSMRLTPAIFVDSSTIECSTSVDSIRQSW